MWTLFLNNTTTSKIKKDEDHNKNERQTSWRSATIKFKHSNQSAPTILHIIDVFIIFLAKERLKKTPNKSRSNKHQKHKRSHRQRISAMFWSTLKQPCQYNFPTSLYTTLYVWIFLSDLLFLSILFLSLSHSLNRQPTKNLLHHTKLQKSELRKTPLNWM